MSRRTGIEIELHLPTKLACQRCNAAAQEYIDQCIAQADTNSDGKIDIDEFVHLMVTHLPDARILL